MKNLILRILFYIAVFGICLFLSGLDYNTIPCVIGLVICTAYILAIITVNEDWLDYI